MGPRWLNKGHTTLEVPLRNIRHGAPEGISIPEVPDELEIYLHPNQLLWLNELAGSQAWRNLL